MTSVNPDTPNISPDSPNNPSKVKKEEGFSQEQAKAVANQMKVDSSDAASLKGRVTPTSVTEGARSIGSVAKENLPSVEKNPEAVLAALSKEQKESALDKLGKLPSLAKKLFDPVKIQEGKGRHKESGVECTVKDGRVTLRFQHKLVDVETGTLTVNPDPNRIGNKQLLELHSAAVNRELGIATEVAEEPPSSINRERLEDARTGIITNNPDSSKIPPRDFQALHEFIVANKEAYMKEVEEIRAKGGTPVSKYFSTRATGLARSIHFSPEGKVYAHLNKKAISPMKLVGVQKGDKPVGTGTFKTVTVAVDLATEEKFASASMPPEEAARELELLEPLKGEKGFLQVEGKVEYVSDKSVEEGREEVNKTRLLFPLANRGDLFDLVTENKLSHDEKVSVAIQLIEALAVMESKGILHRDLKMENVLIRGSGSDIEVIIIDFGLSMMESNTDKLKEEAGTDTYMSPEYSDAAFYGSEEDIEKATTRGNDVWAMGVILDEVLCGGGRRYSPQIPQSSDPNFPVPRHQVAQAIENHKDKKEPPKEEFFKHLVWSMVRVDPKERITVGELVNLLGLPPRA